MTSSIKVKITYPKECEGCGRVIGIGEWAEGTITGFTCESCQSNQGVALSGRSAVLRTEPKVSAYGGGR